MDWNELKEKAADVASNPKVKEALDKGKEALGKGKDWIENGQGKEYLDKGKEALEKGKEKAEKLVNQKTGGKGILGFGANK